MPNHITTIVQINSIYDEDEENYEEQSKKIKDLYKALHTSESDFDFNALIPMPSELKETAADPKIFDSQEEVDSYNTEHQKTWKKVSGVGPIGAITRKEANRRAEKYGYHTSGGGLFRERTEPILDWYTWSIENWGTKWNSYSVRYLDGYGDGESIYGEILVKIETAWTTPEPILKKLADEGFRVTYTWKDEGEEWNNWKEIK